MNYQEERKKELLWYGFLEQTAGNLSTEENDVILDSFGTISLVLNSDLRYGLTIKDHWYGLEEMETLFVYLQRYTSVLNTLEKADTKQLVPPGKVLTNDGDLVYFLFDEGKHFMVLDERTFSIEEALTLLTVLNLTKIVRLKMKERNAERRGKEE